MGICRSIQYKKKDVKAFLGELNKGSLSAGTIRNQKAYLSSILSEAVEDEIIDSNPALMTGKLIKRKNDKEEICPFTWEEKTTFEDGIKEHYPRYYPLFLTDLRTGLRVGELIALQPGDLDFKGKFIEIRRSISISTTLEKGSSINALKRSG